MQDERCREFVGVVGGLDMIRFRNTMRNEGQLWETMIRPSFLLHFKGHPAVAQQQDALGADDSSSFLTGYP